MAGSVQGAMRLLKGLPPDDDSSDDEDLLIAAYALGLLPNSHQQRRRPRYSVKRVMVKRDIRSGWEQSKKDFFDENCIYPESSFRRMYRMSLRLLTRIGDAVVAYDDWFEKKHNAAMNLGANPLQKILAALKILCTGCCPESIDREFRMSPTLIGDSLKRFVRAVVDVYGDEYLRAPNQQDIEVLLDKAEERGFPGMLGNIDCMHWQWEGCPVAWHGEHVGHQKKPTIILEAVADSRLWFWHAYFGLPGSLNDINVLHRSPVFANLAAGRAPPVNFMVNGKPYDKGYYLADGIYPDWATLIKGVAVPLTEKQRLFTIKQSAYRKDVERAFGVLQAKFQIVKGPTRLQYLEDIKYIMRCCVILHNMAIEDEHGMPPPSIHDFDGPGPAPFFPMNQPTLQQLIANFKEIECKTTHACLQQDLLDHVWHKFGHGG